MNNTIPMFAVTVQKLAVLASIFSLLGCEPSPPAAEVADTVFYHGVVYTGVEGDASIEAVAVRNSLIVALGSDQEMLALAGADARRVDLGGNYLLPGFFDNHVHAGIRRGSLMEWKGGLISAVPEWVREARTIPELQQAIERKAGQVEPGEWIMGALSREVWPNQILPLATISISARPRTRCY